MIEPPTPHNETERLDVLRSLELLDRTNDPILDEFTRLAAAISGAPIALVSLVEEHRQWFVARQGLDATETSRQVSFCAHAINRASQVMWVDDARADRRFAANPLVVGHPDIRFYAGAPLVVGGYPIGTLCVIDTVPRQHDPRLVEMLASLARLLSDRLASGHRDEAIRKVLEITADAIIECDDHGVITQWGAGAERLLGFSEDETIGRPVTILIPPEFHDAHKAGMKRWRKTKEARLGRRIELPAVRKDGSAIELELAMSVSRSQKGPLITSSIRDISERKAYSASLLAAKAEAEAANVAKSAFLANMSHEIRTPLNGVVGVVGLLASTPLSPRQEELTEIIRSSSEQLRRILGDVLDLARIESGQFTVSKEGFCLAEQVLAVADLSRLKAEEKGLNFQAVIDVAAEQRVIGDPIRLKQVLGNLLSNAVKFTERGYVRLAITSSPGSYRFEITDSGIGFEQEQNTRLFDPFYQADVSVTRRFGGSGLGLSICRDLVKAMGGEIGCTGRIGQGATFWVQVPLADAEPIVENSAVEDVPQTDAALAVLVVDDNPTNRRVAELILSSVGATVTEAEDGALAFDMARQNRFDIILMDLMMPVMDGLESIRLIRGHEQECGKPRTPIAVLSANSMPEHVEASLAAGADMHLPKPITAPGLLQALAVLVSGRSADSTASKEAGDGIYIASESRAVGA